MKIAKDLLRKMLERRARDRISVDSALRHEWIVQNFLNIKGYSVVDAYAGVIEDGSKKRFDELLSNAQQKQIGSTRQRTRQDTTVLTTKP